MHNHARNRYEYSSVVEQLRFVLLLCTSTHRFSFFFLLSIVCLDFFFVLIFYGILLIDEQSAWVVKLMMELMKKGLALK